MNRTPGIYKDKTDAARGVMLGVFGSLIAAAVLTGLVVFGLWLLGEGVPGQAIWFAVLALTVGAYTWHRGADWKDTFFHRALSVVCWSLAVAAIWPR